MWLMIYVQISCFLIAATAVLTMSRIHPRAGYDRDGHVRAGMGVDAEDTNGDGRPELFVTNYWNEPNSLFINLGDGRFEERSRTSGMMHDSLPWVGWGCALADFDNDGWPDCFVTDGQVDNNLELIGHTNPYQQPALLHRNIDGKRFKLATRRAGPYFELRHVGRGVACGDIDNDGDIDLVINHKGGAAAVLRNDTEYNQSLDKSASGGDSLESRRRGSESRGADRLANGGPPAQRRGKHRLGP